MKTSDSFTTQHPQISLFVALPQLQPSVLGRRPCPRGRSSPDNVGCVLRGRGLVALPVPRTHLHAQARRQLVPDVPSRTHICPRQRGPAAAPAFALRKAGVHFVCALSWVLWFALSRCRCAWTCGRTDGPPWPVRRHWTRLGHSHVALPRGPAAPFCSSEVICRFLAS